MRTNNMIRKKVFETNSSSTHSISLDSTLANELFETLPVDIDGNVIITGGKFGWEWKTYSNTIDKANYSLIYALDWSGDKSEQFLSVLKQIIKEQTQCDNVIFKGTPKKNYTTNELYFDFGYIDHQSVESKDLHYLFESPELLRSFIFNPKSILKTGNDNGYDTNVDVETLTEWAINGTYSDKLDVASHPKSTDSILELLFNLNMDNLEIVTEIISNENTPHHILAIVEADDTYKDIKTTMVYNDNCPADLLVKFLDCDDKYIRMELATNEKLPNWALEQLTTDSDADVAKWAIITIEGKQNEANN